MKSIIPPVSPYGTFHGSLFQYTTPFPSLTAFESVPKHINLDNDFDSIPVKKCILLGGLSDGLIPTPYAKKLEHVCHSLGWSLVQPILSSSYLGFGNTSLKNDSIEIQKLLKYLSSHRKGHKFAIVGHSTGCQNAIHLMKHGDIDITQQIKFIALQAPVSDRESAMLEPNYQENIKYAKILESEGKSLEMMPRDAFWAPITASRFLSLQNFGGDDDFFSSDLSDEQLMERLGHMGNFYCEKEDSLQVLVAFSGKDEYVPSHVDKDILLKRLCDAMNHGEKTVAIPLMLKTGNHNLSEGQDDASIFIDKIEQLMKVIN